MKKNSIILLVILIVAFVLIFGLGFAYYWFGLGGSSELKPDGSEVHRDYMTPNQECNGAYHIEGITYKCVSKKDALVTLDLQPLNECQEFVTCNTDGRYCETKLSPEFPECITCIKNCPEDIAECPKNCMKKIGKGDPE